MKPKNFPARKLRRQLRARDRDKFSSSRSFSESIEADRLLKDARQIRTKKDRSKR